MSLSLDLAGRVALVTGGGTGLGRAATDALVAAGATVVIAGRRADVLEAAAKAAGAQALSCDVSDRDATHTLIARIMDAHGQLDILVNAAGLNIRGDSFEYSFDDWERVHAVNTRGLFFMSQAAGRVMRERGYGKIINIASMASEIGMPGIVAYGSSKGGVRQITQGLAVEWAKSGIRVNAIEPGWFRTELTEPLFSNKEWLAKVESRVPMGRAGMPQEVGGAIAFLASSLSDYVTGAILRVDGGALAA
ncbi:glucose 1-dehydrogenase [Mesorhizobium sp. RP14(2022)]|uniref:Glucose 1-dehydrogenase n=1 Tax=Mesorhizobium liriopis TaxID=2953882 RepID=A0ABT1CCM5_9HYPH|nr:glucose 1-dehydrogenase [Mesorhizobium liriopis]MCO6052268.1 glucose 1-dehydrogenase [Mesorhizobium liriopis]